MNQIKTISLQIILTIVFMSCTNQANKLENLRQFQDDQVFNVWDKQKGNDEAFLGLIGEGKIISSSFFKVSSDTLPYNYFLKNDSIYVLGKIDETKYVMSDGNSIFGCSLDPNNTITSIVSLSIFFPEDYYHVSSHIEKNNILILEKDGCKENSYVYSLENTEFIHPKVNFKETGCK
ncbi:hypothetical protein KMW28_22865 [Flammeovirga yaeyamensis]|uniref:Lipoprotein n=1 Tax=Flammeovirga yaeyamensis TaxID=367791 RepID=A0AAX1NCE5_9BACT|nr:hypothetical protein [Flammeovirga yaeyamensis]MBB3696794.1 hypothetical protein [Flammeovirga yaeyamensis]NMF33460.1 hypothetical protein [Flammeovirga yaeyamensis]QWG05265.1 hypothetical protein KMW28_22865 [Flammeovirga yaeyamensis]